MVKSFGVPPTTVASGIVMYSLAVAGFVMLGAKLNQRFSRHRLAQGARRRCWVVAWHDTESFPRTGCPITSLERFHDSAAPTAHGRGHGAESCELAGLLATRPLGN
jgi:hypothetical protein